MGNLTTSLTRALGPPSSDRELANVTAAIWTGDERHADGAAQLRHELTPALRTRVANRLASVEHALQPASRADISTLVSAMMLGFGNAAGRDPRGTTAAYGAALEAMPYWAVARACGQISRGEVASIAGEKIDKRFPPTAPQLCALVREIVGGLWGEQYRLRQILGGRPAFQPRPEDRERVAKGFADLVARLRGPTERLRADERSLARAAAAALAAKREAVLGKEAAE